MLSIHPQQFDLPRDEKSLDSTPTHELQECEMLSKQTVKKSMLSPYKILLGLGLFFLLIMVSYKVYSQVVAVGLENEINSLHRKIIQNADSSSKDKASNSESTSGKSSKNNDKPNRSSQPATKSPISSNNMGSTGSASDGNNEDDEEDKKNNGQKGKKFLQNNKSSDTKSKTSKDGTSTEEDSDSVESDEEDIFAVETVNWPVNKDEGSAPLIGSLRP